MNIYDEIEKIIDDEVKPLIVSHGGDITLDKFEDGVVTVSLYGACSGCPSADLSTKEMIEEALMAKIDEVKSVEISRSVSPEILNLAKEILGGKFKK